MQKISIVFSVLLTVTIPAAILLLSFNFALRLPQTYEFYFTDSLAISKAGLNIEIQDMSDEIGSYLSSVKESTFQIYEKNGSYNDPVFSKKDRNAMKKIRVFLFKELIAGLCFLAFSILVYEFGLFVRVEEWLRVEAYIASWVTGILLAAQSILMAATGFPQWLYNKFIGVELGKNSNLKLLMTQNFSKTYIIFSLVIGVVMLIIFIYLNAVRTKPRTTVFY
jgi:hypothetical protein